MSNPHIKWLRQAEKEIVSAGHFGWGNTCSDAADCIAELEQQIAAANERTDDLISAQVDVQAELAAVEKDVAALRRQVDAGHAVVNRGVDLMTDEQVGKWAGVRSWLESETSHYMIAAKEGK